MTNRERVQAVLAGEKPDRLPMLEWATWWDQTIYRWIGEGMPSKCIDSHECFAYHGLDDIWQFWPNHRAPAFPAPTGFGHAIMTDEADYNSLRKLMFSEDRIQETMEAIKAVKPQHDRGDFPIWYTLEGFFWFPRTLFGIEAHLYAFYDYPELMHRMNQDQADFSIRFLEALYKVLTPEFMTFAEDMSYNHGPMLSEDCYDEFMLPYYQQLIPYIKERGTKVLIDTDGNVEPLIPWFQEAGIEGVLPLERQAGVDVNRIQEQYPEWIMIGGYDKTIMHQGEEAMRAEFERILPAMRSGRYIPSVDHQTPPDVSLEHYRIYLKLLQEYATLAV